MSLLVVITGPTASGKTQLSVSLAQSFGTSVVSADARQVYRRLNIGTNKITKDEMQGVPHYMIDIVEPDQHYTAGRYVREAEQILIDLFKNHEIVFLVGGTGFYIQALLCGLDEMPAVPEDVRIQLNEDLKYSGLSNLLEELKRDDPKTYNSIDIHNPKRILRALEIIRTSGKPFSEFKGKKSHVLPYQVLFIVLTDDRIQLYKRINERVKIMLENGLIDEVQKLLDQGFTTEHTALQTIGYYEPIQYLDQRFGYEEMVNLIQQNTRHYAKRQLTWCKNGIPKIVAPAEIKWFLPHEFQNVKDSIEKRMQLY